MAEENKKADKDDDEVTEVLPVAQLNNVDKIVAFWCEIHVYLIYTV